MPTHRGVSISNVFGISRSKFISHTIMMYKIPVRTNLDPNQIQSFPDTCFESVLIINTSVVISYEILIHLYPYLP